MRQKFAYREKDLVTKIKRHVYKVKARSKRGIGERVNSLA